MFPRFDRILMQNKRDISVNAKACKILKINRISKGSTGPIICVGQWVKMFQNTVVDKYFYNVLEFNNLIYKNYEIVKTKRLGIFLLLNQCFFSKYLYLSNKERAFGPVAL